MTIRSVDHIGITVNSLDVSVPWWSRLLGSEPFERRLWLASETDDRIGRIVGYPECDLSSAAWALPGGTVLELLEYHRPRSGTVNMETYNAGNTHLCLETSDLRADIERLRGHAEFRSAYPVPSVAGPFAGKLVCYLRGPDGVSVELVQFPAAGRPFDDLSPYADPRASQQE